MQPWLARASLPTLQTLCLQFQYHVIQPRRNHSPPRRSLSPSLVGATHISPRNSSSLLVGGAHRLSSSLLVGAAHHLSSEPLTHSSEPLTSLIGGVVDVRCGGVVVNQCIDHILSFLTPYVCSRIRKHKKYS